MDAKISAFNRLAEFARFAGSEGVGNDSVAKFDAASGKVSLNATDHVRGVFTSWTTKGRDVEANNRTRDAFKSALLGLFNKQTVEELPRSVLNVLKAGDFDDTGKPLSARRINAVMTMVRDTDDYRNTEPYAKLQRFGEACAAPVAEEAGPADIQKALDGYAEKICSVSGGDLRSVIDLIGAGFKMQGVVDLARACFTGIATRSAVGGDLLLNTRAAGGNEIVRTSVTGRTFAEALDLHVQRTKDLMQSVFDKENPSAHPADAKEVFDKIFAELDKAADRIKIRQFAIDNRHALGMDSVAANVNEAGRLVAVLRNAGLSTNDALGLLAGQVQAAADTPAGASMGDRVALLLLVRDLKAELGLTGEQAAKFETYVGTVTRELASTPFDFNKEKGVIQMQLGLAARLAMGGKAMPARVHVLGMEDFNGSAAECFLRLARGRENLALRLAVVLRTPSTANLALRTGKEALAELEQAPVLERAKLYRLIVGSEPQVDLGALTRRQFERQVEDDLVNAAKKLIRESRPDLTNSMALDFEAAKLWMARTGANGLMLRDEAMFQLQLHADQGVHVTFDDVQAAGAGYNVAQALNQGEKGLRDQFKMDLPRNRPVISFGGEKIDCGKELGRFDPDTQPELFKAKRDALELLILDRLGKFAATDAQKLVCGMLLTQAGQSLGSSLNTGDNLGDHASLVLNITKNDADGSLTVSMDKSGNEGEPALKYAYVVRPDGENELTELDFILPAKVAQA